MKVHYGSGDIYTFKGQECKAGACGAANHVSKIRVSTDPKEVTCIKCLRVMQTGAKDNG